MDQISLAAGPRQRRAKGDNRRLRRQGRVPAVIYGGETQPSSIELDGHAVDLVLRGSRHSNAIFQLQLEGAQPEPTLIRDVQRHPVTNRLIHIDFQRINLDEAIVVEVPVHASAAVPAGVRAGGVLEHLLRQVEVRCRPTEIPQFIEADLSGLNVNQTFHISDLQLPEGIEILDDADTALFVVKPPAAGVEEAPAEGEAPAEPELVKTRKEQEESSEA